MKLLMCDHCGDVFNLTLSLKACSCGRTKGMYVNNTDAEVNGHGFSLAIGNGALWQAIAATPEMTADFRKGGDPWRKHATTILAWARPHEGPANPHTRINPAL